MVQGLERYFKAAIVDKNPAVASAALVSAYHMFEGAPDVIRRWSAEASEAIATPRTSVLLPGSASSIAPNSSGISQYHALGLLYQIREKDRMAVTKMIQQLSASSNASRSSSAVLKNPMAICLIIRYASKVMKDDLK